MARARGNPKLSVYVSEFGGITWQYYTVNQENMFLWCFYGTKNDKQLGNFKMDNVGPKCMYFRCLIDWFRS